MDHKARMTHTYKGIAYLRDILSYLSYLPPPPTPCTTSVRFPFFLTAMWAPPMQARSSPLLPKCSLDSPSAPQAAPHCPAPSSDGRKRLPKDGGEHGDASCCCSWSNGESTSWVRDWRLQLYPSQPHATCRPPAGQSCPASRV